MDNEPKRVLCHFTFGSGHLGNYSLPFGGTLSDYWVTVDLPEGSDLDHRAMFIAHFTTQYCPRPMQWAMEYSDMELNPIYFPHGQLCVINENGIVKDG